MKILFFTENFPPETNAAASRVYERALYWVKWGHDITVVTTAPNFPMGKLFPGYKNKFYHTEIIEGIRVVRVMSFIAKNEKVFLRTFDFLSFMVSGFIAGCFQKKHDMIIGTSPQFFTVIAAYGVALFKRTPYVFELGDIWPESIKAVGAISNQILINFLESIELFLYRKSAAVVVLTEAFKHNLIARNIDKEKIKVVLNGVNTEVYKPMAKDMSLSKKLGIENHFVIGYIGTLGMAHGLDNIIDAAVLLKNVQNITFIFVGEGAEKKMLQSKAASKELCNVIFISHKTKSEITRYWSLCNMALVHLKNDELFSTVLPSKAFEAMGMGLPILAVAPRGELTRLVQSNDIGIVIEPGRPQKLADEITNLKQSKDRLDGWSKNSLLCSKKYSREKQAKKMENILLNILRNT